MKTLLFIFCFSVYITSYSQVSGEIATANRKIATTIPYSITGHDSTGKFVFKIAVNPSGKVTSCVLQKDQSTIVSTPLMIKAKNTILSGLTFESGSAFPNFQYGWVTIEVVPSNE